MIASRKGDTAAVACLLQHASIDINKADKGGFTPLYIASKKGHKDVVAQLLQHSDCFNLRSLRHVACIQALIAS
jgi:ankyrin repeat protein